MNLEGVQKAAWPLGAKTYPHLVMLVSLVFASVRRPMFIDSDVLMAFRPSGGGR